MKIPTNKGFLGRLLVVSATGKQVTGQFRLYKSWLFKSKKIVIPSKNEINLGKGIVSDNYIKHSFNSLGSPKVII